MGGRIDIKPDNIAQLVDELRVVGELELVDPVRLETTRAPDPLDGTRAVPTAFATIVAVQWVAWGGGWVGVSATPAGRYPTKVVGGAGVVFYHERGRGTPPA